MKDQYNLKIIDEEYKNKLDVNKLEQTINRTTQCYKYYWFEAIVKLLKEGKYIYTYDEIFNEMICNVWYTVAEYHLHMGPRKGDGSVKNSLEQIVYTIQLKNALPAGLKKRAILKAIHLAEPYIREEKKQLEKYVPERFLSPFLNIKKDSEWNKDVVKKIKEKEHEVPYIIITKPHKAIEVDPVWHKMMMDYKAILLGWVDYKKIVYLQKRNPNVPGIVYKIKPYDDFTRDMNAAKKLWVYAIDEAGITNIYENDDQMTNDDVSLDHFIPWSYVTNDELWNLIPTTNSINSSKSNNIPDLEYLKDFIDNQYKLNELIQKDVYARKLYEKCKDHNLTESWAVDELYKPIPKDEFSKIMKKHLMPIYNSAESLGYQKWSNSHYK